MITSPALRYGWPLYTVTLVNKMASIALSLLPALLVARECGTATAALAMGIARAGTLVGTLLSGPIADRLGLRPTLIGSLCLSGTGVAIMGASSSLWMLVAGALTAQLGMGMFPTAMRLLLVGTVPIVHQREALGWQRGVSNGGLIVSFTIGGLLGGTHIGWLLAIDATASLVAALLAFALVPASPVAQMQGPQGASSPALGLFVQITAIMAGWRLAYEVYLTASAALLQRAFGDSGVSLYSWLMVMNTVLCTLFAVLLARVIDNPRWSVPLGMLLLVIGASLGLLHPELRWLTALGMAIATAGELLFSATSTFVWMTMLPDGPNRSTVYSIASTATHAMSALGSALAFPLVVDAERPWLGMVLISLPGLLLCTLAGRLWRGFSAAGGAR